MPKEKALGMEEKARQRSHLPWALLLYIPVLLRALHRIEAMRRGFAGPVVVALTIAYFLIPAATLAFSLGEWLDLRRYEKLKALFPPDKPSPQWLLMDLLWFVVIPVLSWIAFR